MKNETMYKKTDLYDLYKTLYPDTDPQKLKQHIFNMILDGKLHIRTDEKGVWLVAEWWLMKQENFTDYVKKTMASNEFIDPGNVRHGNILVGANMIVRPDKRGIKVTKIIKGLAMALSFIYPEIDTCAYWRVKRKKYYIRPILEVINYGR